MWRVLVAMSVLLIVILGVLVSLPARSRWPPSVSPDEELTGVVVTLVNVEQRLESARRLVNIAASVGVRLRILAAVDRRKGGAYTLPEGFWDLSTFTPPFLRDALRAGEVGCMESHASAWLDLALSGGVVLEDDVSATPEDFSYMMSYAKELKHRDVVLHATRIIPWSYSYSTTERAPDEVFDVRLMRCNSENYTTCFYYMSAPAIRICRDLYDTAVAHGRMLPSDDFLSVVANVHWGTRREPMASAWPPLPRPLVSLFPKKRLSVTADNFGSTTSA